MRGAMMPAGRYYVGDLCYVMHDRWDEACNVTLHGGIVLNGTFNLPDGKRFAMFSTQWGDGSYSGNDGNNYCVDSGSIGCILLSDITDKEHKHSIESKLGHVHDFAEPFRVSENEGVIKIGHIHIDTDPQFDYDQSEEFV